MVAQLKIRRKDLRQPDEFIEFTGQAWQWVRDNRRATTISAVAVILIILAVAGVRQYRAYRQANAAEAFRTATALFAEGDTKGARAALEQVPRIHFYGALADLYAGRAALTDADATAAAEAFRAATSHSDLPPYLRQQALYGLALAVAQQGDAAGALALHEEAAELPGPLTVDARLAAARLTQAAGDPAKARSLFERAVIDAEESGPLQNDMRHVAAWKLATIPATAAQSPAPRAQ